jgi:uncharacterized repeat protein (TIGR01451 family)
MYIYSSLGFFDKNKSDSTLEIDGAERRQKSTVKQSFIVSVFLLILIATTVFALGSNITGNIIANTTNQSGESNLNAINESVINESIYDNVLPEDVDIQNISQQQDVVGVINESVINESTNTGSEGNVTLPENSTSPEENTTSATNETVENETGVLEFPQYNETDETSDEGLNVTLPEMNETQENVTMPEQNASENITLPEDNVTNATLPEENITQSDNETIDEIYNQTNQTVEVNETITPEIPEIKPTPELNIELFVPQKVTRGEVVSLQTIVRNVGSVEAKNVVIRWSLPNYFVASDDLFKGCGTVAVGGYCEHTIEVVVTRSAELGLNEVRVFVEYE